MAEASTAASTAILKHQMTARALLLGERIDVAGLERSDVISTTPLAFRAGHEGYAVLFRYGALVLIGLSVVEEDELIRGLKPRIVGAFSRPGDESVAIEIAPERDDQIAPGGPISTRDLSPPRLLVIADLFVLVGERIDRRRDERDACFVEAGPHVLLAREDQAIGVGQIRTEEVPRAAREFAGIVGADVTTPHDASAPLLQGAEVDYVDSLQGSGFSIKNPQAKTTCGCGSSFSA